MINAESAAYRNDVNIAAIYTFRVTSQAQLFKFLHDIILITGFAICSDVIKTFFKTKTFLWCILEADRKAFLIFGRKRKFWRKWNSIYGLKRKRTFIFGQKRNESHLIILVFFFFFIHSVTTSALQFHANTSSSFGFFCKWSLLTGFHFPHVQCIDIFVAVF